MKTVAFCNESAAFVTLSWTADADYSIVGCYSAGGAVVLSKDPSRTFSSTIFTPTAGVFDELILISNNDLNTNWDFPLSKGEKIYCAMNNQITTALVALVNTTELIS